NRTTVGWSNFTIYFHNAIFDPDASAYFYLNNSQIKVYRISIYIISNDTYDYYGASHFDIIINHSLIYSINSEFDVNFRNFLLSDGVNNPYAISIVSTSSRLYLDNMYSSCDAGKNMPFFSIDSCIFYFRTTVVDDFSDNYIDSAVNDSISAFSDFNDRTVDQINSYMFNTTSEYYPWNRISEGSLPLLAWLYNGSMQYTGNYIIDNFNTVEYFSLKPFPDIRNDTHLFSAEYTVPDIYINTTLPLILYNKENALPFTVRSL
ncbi:MAG: hypothetical protein ACP5UV_01625, partial [Thermoplasmata archaeon]